MIQADIILFGIPLNPASSAQPSGNQSVKKESAAAVVAHEALSVNPKKRGRQSKKLETASVSKGSEVKAAVQNTAKKVRLTVSPSEAALAEKEEELQKTKDDLINTKIQLQNTLNHYQRLGVSHYDALRTIDSLNAELKAYRACLPMEPEPLERQQSGDALSVDSSSSSSSSGSSNANPMPALSGFQPYAASQANPTEDEESTDTDFDSRTVSRSSTSSTDLSDIELDASW